MPRDGATMNESPVEQSVKQSPFSKGGVWLEEPEG